jgi:hypothetical protein
MRYLVLDHTRDGRPYIRGEVVDPEIVSDATDEVVQRERAGSDPELMRAVDEWDKKSDLLPTIHEPNTPSRKAVGASARHSSTSITGC